ncbi:hypothetical protein [Streptomyces sp. SYP-A7185]|uniref:hypothetical protein n=1 Tax=Streptomyces sp. SYP-A7185 TaxID=3040076 RepID=UPI0038F664C7
MSEILNSKRNVPAEVGRLRAKKAATKRNYPDADTTDIDRALKTANAESYIRKIVDSAPELTASQLAKLADLLRPSMNGGARDEA